MNRLTKIASSIMTGLLAFPLVATIMTSPVLAKTTTVVEPAKEIVINSGANGLNSGVSSAASNAAQGMTNSGGVDSLASNAGTIVQQAKDGGQSVAAGAVDVSRSIANTSMNNANNFAGPGTNTTGLDLWGIFTRLDQFLTDGATNGISLLLKIVYWSSVLSVVIGLIAVIWALIPGTKAKVWKPLIGLVSAFIFFGIVSSVAGVDIFNNPIVQAAKWIFTGQQ